MSHPFADSSGDTPPSGSDIAGFSATSDEAAERAADRYDFGEYRPTWTSAEPAAFAPAAFVPPVFESASLDPAAFAPAEPDAFEPDAFEPDAFGPDAFPRDAFTRDAFAPAVPEADSGSPSIPARGSASVPGSGHGAPPVVSPPPYTPSSYIPTPIASEPPAHTPAPSYTPAPAVSDPSGFTPISVFTLARAADETAGLPLIREGTAAPAGTRLPTSIHRPTTAWPAATALTVTRPAYDQPASPGLDRNLDIGYEEREREPKKGRLTGVFAALAILFLLATLGMTALYYQAANGRDQQVAARQALLDNARKDLQSRTDELNKANQDLAAAGGRSTELGVERDALAKCVSSTKAYFQAVGSHASSSVVSTKAKQLNKDCQAADQYI